MKNPQCTLAIIILVLMSPVLQLSGQQPTRKVVTPGAAPKAVPYLLKKDFETALADINSKIGAAQNTASSVRRELNAKLGKVEKVDELDAKMQQVEQILNSANFQIAITNDSLKNTKFSIEELRKETETIISDLKSKNDSLNMNLWIMFGIAVALIVGLLGFFSMKMNKLSVGIRRQSETLKGELQTLNELREEAQKQRGKIQGDIYTLKAELIGKFNRDHEELLGQMEQMIKNADDKK